MKAASLTKHAKQRISERCSLSVFELKRILNSGASIPIQLQKGGRHAHRLIYSCKDADWFMVVQDGNDGGILTVMPLEYLDGRTDVTAADKRQARSRAEKVSNTKEAKACGWFVSKENLTRPLRQQKPKNVQTVLPLLKQAFENCVKNDGWANYTLFTNELCKIKPNFDYRTYGCSSLKKLIGKFEEVIVTDEWTRIRIIKNDETVHFGVHRGLF